MDPEADQVKNDSPKKRGRPKKSESSGYPKSGKKAGS
jgi:hypothetical protein